MSSKIISKFSQFPIFNENNFQRFNKLFGFICDDKVLMILII
jgi:hypothetical protein